MLLCYPLKLMLFMIKLFQVGEWLGGWLDQLDKVISASAGLELELRLSLAICYLHFVEITCLTWPTAKQKCYISGTECPIDLM